MTEMHYVVVCATCANGDCCYQPHDGPADIEHAERALEAEGWLLWPEVYCPDCNPFLEETCAST